jgi:hypothetical protein
MIASGDTDRAARPPRIDPLTRAAWTVDQRRLPAGAPPLRLSATLVRHHTLLRAWPPFASALQSGGLLPGRDRELLVLRTAWNDCSEYEWGPPRAAGREGGLSPLPPR